MYSGLIIAVFVVMNSANDYSLERKILELTVLHEISQLLISHSETQDVLGPILEILNSKMGMERGTITLIDSESYELVIEVAHGLTPEEIKRGHYQLGEGVTGTVVEKGEPMIVPRVGKNPLFLDRTRSRQEIHKDDISFICVPIRIGDLTFGALSVDRIFSENISLNEDVRFLTIMASTVAQAVRINRMAMEEGSFREDLYYRLNIFPIYMPPLRERKTDILLLADFFMEKYSKKYGKEVKRISTPAIDAIIRYHWPGNVRELENCIERAMILCSDKVIHGHHLPPTLQTAETSNTYPSGSLKESLEGFERGLIIDSLKSSKGNMAKAARLVGTSERIMGMRVKKFGINPLEFKRGDIHFELRRDYYKAWADRGY